MGVRAAYETAGKWGKNLATRFILDIARTAGLSGGERVEIEACSGARSRGRGADYPWGSL